MIMTQLCEPLASVFLFGAFSVLGIISLASASTQFFSRKQLRQVVAEEAGAAYAISYVMVIPFYALLMSMVIETSAMLPAKIGSVYSAYAAARTACVWSSATDWENAEQKAIAAGRRAIVPFVSGTQGFRVDSVTEKSARYVLAHQQLSDQPMKNKYLINKFGYAQRSVSVFVDKPKAWNDDVSATVLYEFPFNIPGIARLFGRQRNDGSYYFPITSKVTLTNQGPQYDQAVSNNNNPTNQQNRLGIGYGTLE